MNDDFIKVLDLDLMSEKNKEEFDSDINNKKKLGEYSKKARALVKDSKCLYCNKEVTSFCNSHSIPEFCLRNIAEDGKVLTLNTLIDVPFIKKETGLGETGTFQIICRDCDSKIFSEYENPQNYDTLPTQKMLAQIALKNNLKYISKRKQEIGMHKVMEAEMQLPSGMFDYDDYIKILDMNEYIDGYIIIILIEILIGKSLSFTLRFFVFIILLILQFAIFIVALAKVKEKNYQVEKDVTQHKKRISLYTFFGLFLLFLGGLLTLFFGKTNWVWQLIFLPILLISTYGTIKYAFYILIFKKDFKIKTLRCVINILSLILMISLCIVFSDDAAFNAKEGSVDLILLTFIIIFFALPFKTGYTCNKVIRSKKSDA